MIEHGEASPGAALEAAVPRLRAELRLDGETADGELGRCLRAAAGLCEAFTGTGLIDRDVVETVGHAPVRADAWTALSLRPVRAITAVARSGGGALAASDYRLDISADGTGLVRVAGPVRVTYRAGLAEDWAGVPEPLAFGVVRLAGHLWTVRDGDGAVPAAVAALWSPWRLLRLGAPDPSRRAPTGSVLPRMSGEAA